MAGGAIFVAVSTWGLWCEGDLPSKFGGVISNHVRYSHSRRAGYVSFCTLEYRLDPLVLVCLNLEALTFSVFCCSPQGASPPTSKGPPPGSKVSRVNHLEGPKGSHLERSITSNLPRIYRHRRYRMYGRFRSTRDSSSIWRRYRQKQALEACCGELWSQQDISPTGHFVCSQGELQYIYIRPKLDRPCPF